MDQAQWEGPLDGFVRVEVFDSRAQAEVARSALEASDIASTLLADDDGGVGGISLSLGHQGAELRVAPEQWAAARAALGLSVEPTPASPPLARWVMIAAATVAVAVAASIALSIVG